MKTLFAILTMVTTIGTLARAEALDDKQVPADSQWLAHVDVSAAKTAVVSQTVSAQWLKLPAAKLRLQQLTWLTGLDPRQHLQGITIYGRSYAQDAAVVIVRAKVDRQRLQRFVSGRPDFHTRQYGQYELLGWTDKKGKPDEHTVTGCFFGSDVLVFGRDDDEVRNALDVLAGKSPSLSEKDPLYASAAPPGTMIQVRGIGLADVKLPFESPLVRKSNFLIAMGGESDRQTFAEARVTTESEEVAGQLRAVLDGLLAMSRLRFDSDEEILRVLDAVNVSLNGNTVKVQCRWPSDQVSKLFEKAWKIQRNQK